MADANRKVYVYDTSGVLQGSWTAGTLTSKAQVEGITTFGNDIWIVDNKTEKVFKYSAAAGLVSGSLNSSSSFSLNSGNSNAKGIVTDGTSIWVINDSTNDKVFKYDMTGTLLGSWTIDAANSSPTGLTIDPSNVSNIWTVDSGTKTIYQYNGVANKLSGSQSAAVSYALAANNSNPQDIANPPVSGMETSSLTFIADGVSNTNGNASPPVYVDSVINAFVQPRRGNSQIQSSQTKPDILIASKTNRNPELVDASEWVTRQLSNATSVNGRDLEMNDFALLELLNESSSDALSGAKKTRRVR